jgi:hypothetical protein
LEYSSPRSRPDARDHQGLVKKSSRLKDREYKDIMQRGAQTGDKQGRDSVF